MDDRLQGLINELMTAWQEGRGETEIRASFAEILTPFLQDERIQVYREKWASEDDQQERVKAILTKAADAAITKLLPTIQQYEQEMQDLGEANAHLLADNTQMRALLVGWYGLWGTQDWRAGTDALADATREFVNKMD